MTALFPLIGGSSRMKNNVYDFATGSICNVEVCLDIIRHHDLHGNSDFDLMRKVLGCATLSLGELLLMYTFPAFLLTARCLYLLLCRQKLSAFSAHFPECRVIPLNSDCMTWYNWCHIIPRLACKVDRRFWRKSCHTGSDTPGIRHPPRPATNCFVADVQSIRVSINPAS